MSFPPTIGASSQRANWLLFATLPICTAGSVVLVAGWIGNIAPLQSLHPSLGITVFNTSLCLFLLCVSFWGLNLSAAWERVHVLSRCLAAAVVILCGLTLIEYGAHVDLEIDQVLVADMTNIQEATFPGRMPISACVVLMLIGFAAILIDTKLLGRYYPGQYLTTVAGVVGFVIFCIHIFDISSHSQAQYHQMSFQTTVQVMGLCMAYMALRPAQGIMADFNSPYMGGTVARRLLPVAAIGPLLLGCLLWYGESKDLYSSKMAVALLILGLSSVFSLLIWWTARSLNAAEHKQRIVESRLTVAFEAAPYGMFILDSSGAIVQANSQGARMFGYTLRELQGVQFYRIVPQYAMAEKAPDEKTKADGECMPGPVKESTARKKDGQAMAVELSLNAMPFHGDNYSFAVVVDISARKETQSQLEGYMRELERSNSELEQFAYVASHDLQEPLRMVGSYVQLLERRYSDKLDDDAREFIGFAVEGANRMQQLINDLLMLSRVGRRGREIVRTDSGKALGRALFNLKAAIDESGADIVHEDLPWVYADESQLVQLFQNLIGNAIKFHGEAPPRIEVTALRNGSDQIFAIRDNGIGIDPQYRSRIFLVFQRLHTRQTYPGTGIGLALCKRIIDRHGGRIWVDSNPEGGSVFYFTLNDAPQAEAAHAAV